MENTFSPTPADEPPDDQGIAQQPTIPLEPLHTSEPPAPLHEHPNHAQDRSLPAAAAPVVPDAPTAVQWYDAQGPIPPLPAVDTAPAGRPRRRRRFIALMSLGLVAVLALGLVLGSALANGKSASTPTVTVASSTSSASTGTAQALQQSVESVLQSVEPSVVEITSTGYGGEAIGSGDILTSNGYIVTNDHVVQGYTSFTVTLASGKNYAATLIGQDAQNDLAVLKVSASGLKAITLGDSSKAAVGEFVVAVGNPLGLQESATFGIVSALNRTASEAPSGPAGELTGLIQTSAQLNPGNSGGALVNLEGQLIGIPTLGAEDTETGTAANGIGYAIPSDQVASIANQLIKSGSSSSTSSSSSSGQAFLGIQAQDVTAQVAAADGLSVQSGVLIVGFAADTAGQSPAQQAGLQAGDVITAVNGQTIASSANLASALQKDAPGARVTLTIVRGTSQGTVTVTLGARPANS